MLAPPELLKVHPLGKSPIISDGPLVIAESGAIVEYLLEKYDTTNRFTPPSAPVTTENGQIANPKITNLYYSHFSEGTIMPYLSNYLIFTIVPERAPWFMRWLLRPVFRQVREMLIMTNIRKAAEMVSAGGTVRSTRS